MGILTSTSELIPYLFKLTRRASVLVMSNADTLVEREKAFFFLSLRRIDKQDASIMYVRKGVPGGTRKKPFSTWDAVRTEVASSICPSYEKGCILRAVYSKGFFMHRMQYPLHGFLWKERFIIIKGQKSSKFDRSENIFRKRNSKEFEVLESDAIRKLEAPRGGEKKNVQIQYAGIAFSDLLFCLFCLSPDQLFSTILISNENFLAYSTFPLRASIFHTYWLSIARRSGKKEKEKCATLEVFPLLF